MNYRGLLFRYRTGFRLAALLLVCLASGLMFAPSAYAQSGTINASLNPCTIPGGGSNCTTAVTWNSYSTSSVQVWVSVNGGAQSNVWTTGSGMNTQNATWIQGPPNSYVFYLYDYSSGSRGATLASTPVTGKYAVTWSITDSTRSLGSNFVVGDNWYLSVSGAPSYASVQIQWTRLTGGGNSTYSAGNTDAFGNFGASSNVLSGSIGRWTGQGLVASVAAGDPFGTEIIAAPTGISIFSVPSGINCAQTNYQPYGFGIQNLNWALNGLVYGVYEIPITAHVWISYAGGSYHDATVSQGSLPNFNDPHEPIGWCSNVAFTANTVSESFEMRIGGLSGASIRTNYWVQTSTSPHAGEMTNHDDVDLVIP